MDTNLQKIRVTLDFEVYEDFDVNLFTIEELMPILNFVRGDDEEGSISFR